MEFSHPCLSIGIVLHRSAHSNGGLDPPWLPWTFNPCPRTADTRAPRPIGHAPWQARLRGRRRTAPPAAPNPRPSPPLPVQRPLRPASGPARPAPGFKRRRRTPARLTRPRTATVRDAGERSHLPQGRCVTYQMAEVPVGKSCGGSMICKTRSGVGRGNRRRGVSDTRGVYGWREK